MPEIATAHGKIHYEERSGGAPAVLFVHSSGMSSRQWLGLAMTIEERGSRAVAVDLVGYGASDPWDEASPFTLDAAVDGVVAVLDAIGEPAVLVGHSYGALLALFAALRRPSRVLGLLVHEPVAWGVLRAAEPQTVADAFAVIDRDGLFFDEARGGSEAWFSRFIGFWSGEGTFEALSSRQQAAFLARGRQTFLEVVKLCRDETPASAYSGIDVPVRITRGEASPPIERRVCELLAAAIPRGTLVELPGGHMAPLTHGDAFRRELDALLAAI